MFRSETASTAWATVTTQVAHTLGGLLLYGIFLPLDGGYRFPVVCCVTDSHVAGLRKYDARRLFCASGSMLQVRSERRGTTHDAGSFQ